MTKQEFEKLTGLNVSTAVFEVINNMYMNAGDKIDKEIFCKDWKEHGDSVLLKTFFSQSERLRDKLDLFREKIYQAALLLVGKAHVYNDSDLRREAVRLVGEHKVVIITLDGRLPLWDEDIQFIKENLKGNVSK